MNQTWSLWCLAMFAFHLWESLGPLRPLGKFVVVKWVVFASWWQGVIITGLVSLGLLPAVLGFTEADVAAGLQDFLITFEMLAAAYLWRYMPESVRNRFGLGWEAAFLVPVIILFGYLAVSASPVIDNTFFDGSLRQWFTDNGINYEEMC